MAYDPLQTRPGGGRRGAILCPLQCLLFLAFLVLATVMGVAASDAAANDEGVAVKANSSMDEAPSESDLAVPEDGEAAAQDVEAGSERPLLAKDEGELLSNVELKTVSPHNGDKKSPESPGSSPGATGTSTPSVAKEEEEAKAREKYQKIYGQAAKEAAAKAVEEEKEAKEKEKYKKIYSKAAKEAAATARAMENAPKSARYHALVGPTMQDAEYEKLQADLAKLSPEKRAELMEKRRKDKEAKEDMRKKYGEVIKELKQKLAEREQRKAAGAKQAKLRSKSI